MIVNARRLVVRRRVARHVSPFWIHEGLPPFDLVILGKRKKIVMNVAEDGGIVDDGFGDEGCCGVRQVEVGIGHAGCVWVDVMDGYGWGWLGVGPVRTGAPVGASGVGWWINRKKMADLKARGYKMFVVH
ncbi:uncharacterized protein An11g05690 [Aspergillus niger]|uniref:Contig An11c0220, genomic contig n=2 Tax=Aspergillus niger TaxID=5061 RepID=A2QWM2_ASPNC|nr:uncharacterized protein An11g05690 [Aspergillus niger]CAK40726.1 unnamed protein product [Aspergillus niger]